MKVWWVAYNIKSSISVTCVSCDSSVYRQQISSIGNKLLKKNFVNPEHFQFIPEFQDVMLIYLLGVNPFGAAL